MRTTKQPTKQEIQDAIEYLRGDSHRPLSELDYKIRELKRNRNFTGCLGVFVGVFAAGAIGGLASGYMAGGVILLTVFAFLFFLFLQSRSSLTEDARIVEEMKRKEDADARDTHPGYGD